MRTALHYVSVVRCVSDDSCPRSLSRCGLGTTKNPADTTVTVHHGRRRLTVTAMTLLQRHAAGAVGHAVTAPGDCTACLTSLTALTAGFTDAREDPDILVSSVCIYVHMHGCYVRIYLTRASGVVVWCLYSRDLERSRACYD